MWEDMGQSGAFFLKTPSNQRRSGAHRTFVLHLFEVNPPTFSPPAAAEQGSQTVFLGEYIHNLDSKGRLTIPAKFREQLISGLVVTRNPAGGCLLLMPMDEWNRVAERVSALPLTDRRSALLRRVLFSAAENLKPDRQGRILISQRLRDFAHIDEAVLIAGMNKYVELWNPQAWEEQVLAQLQDEELSDDLFAALGV